MSHPNTEEQYPEIEMGLSLSKAEGNLNFLAQISNSPSWGGSMTQGQAILDALHAVQEARKKLQTILYEQRKK